MGRSIAVDVVSDVVCPWCFIGKRRLERALRERGHVKADLHWRPFQLDPTIPPGGVDRKTYLARKFGGADRAAQVYEQIRIAGEAEGISFALERIERSPNTLDAHRLIRWAGTEGKQDEIVERLFRLYFQEGQDIGDRTVLLSAAEEVGLDLQSASRALHDATGVRLVQQEIESGRALGITGVPCFIFDGRLAVLGAEQPQVLIAAMDKVLEQDAAIGSGASHNS